MSDVDLDLSRQFARRAAPQACYKNAALALCLDTAELRGATYVEGIAVVEAVAGCLLAVEHGWLELAGGQIVDPTWSDGRGRAYFPILRLSRQEVGHAVLEHAKLPVLFDRYGFGGNQHPGTQPAWQAAAAWIARDKAGPRRLLILACSASKAAHPAPAIELYQGPLYRILRGALRAGAEVMVWILSAEHGLIPADRRLHPYDRRMTASRSRELAPQVHQVLQDNVAQQGPYAEAYIELGRDYLAALPAEEELREILGCRLHFGQGPIGKRGQALKSWLRGNAGRGKGL